MYSPLYPPFLTIILLITPSVLCKQYINSRALKIFNDSVLVKKIECDGRKDHCEDFTSFHIYAFAAKVPPSGARGYITDEPQFACGHVEPPDNDTIGWAALVFYTTMNCDCSYEEKILHVQAAGYKIALLMEVNNCSDDIGNNDTNITHINIPAVLVSKSVGLLLLEYSWPTDTDEPSGVVVVEAHYETDHTTLVLVGLGFGGFLILAMIASLWCYQYFRRKYKQRVAAIGQRQYRSLPETKVTNDLPKPSDETESNDTETEELPEFTSHDDVPLQMISSDKQQCNRYGSVSRPNSIHGNQLKL